MNYQYHINDKKDKIINEKKVIDYLFKNKNNLYDIDNYLTNEGILDTAKKLSSVDGVKELGKTIAKSAGKAVLNFAAFNFICSNIASNMNKTWAVKAQANAIIKQLYPDAMRVLAFFYKSMYSLIIVRGFKKYYSWDLAMAAILLYKSSEEDRGITYAYSESKKITPTILKDEILDFSRKIQDKRLTVDPLTKKVISTDTREDGFGRDRDRYDRGDIFGDDKKISPEDRKKIDAIASLFANNSTSIKTKDISQVVYSANVPNKDDKFKEFTNGITTSTNSLNNVSSSDLKTKYKTFKYKVEKIIFNDKELTFDDKGFNITDVSGNYNFNDIKNVASRSFSSITKDRVKIAFLLYKFMIDNPGDIVAKMVHDKYITLL